MPTEIQYLHHSGVSVKTPNHFFVFDYDGTPAEYDRPVFEPHSVVFVSHRHGDHLHPAVFSWKKKSPGLRLILSYDITAEKGDFSVCPDEILSLEGMTIQALGSTDEGVAFLVKADGLTIYHAGDLNWWHWNGESRDYNLKMERDYRREIEKLKGVEVDFAFVPLDPRLEDAYLYGLDLFARTARPKIIFPIHLWDDYSVVNRLKSDPRAADYSSKVVEIAAPGQLFSF